MINMCQCWTNLKIFDKAVKCLKNAVKLRESETICHKYLMIKLFLSLRKFESALQIIKEMDQSHTEIVILKGICFYNLDKLIESRKMFIDLEKKLKSST